MSRPLWRTNLETTETGAQLDDHLNGKVHARETNLETTETGAQCGMRGESS